ncbi:interferon alpha/beta receptor 2-like [Trichomycterus rosablanca]|uniref:interferon alpha/beta receptor 2-like n=1 Tax=Trichomycterus rosablanca TaxID=2290929 RepID=UPI002F35938A
MNMRIAVGYRVSVLREGLTPTLRSVRMNCSRQYWMLIRWTFLFCLIHEGYCLLPVPQNVTIISFNMKHKLTWRPGPGTPAFTLFQVESYNQRRKRWNSILNCSDLQIGESCDLTRSFRDVFSYYLARVQAFSPDQESNWTNSMFFHPLTDTTLGPPEVSLAGCGNCLLLKLSAPASSEQLLELYFYQQYHVNVSRTRDKAQFSIKASNGENLINYLEPEAEYCITVVTVSSSQNPVLPSAPHCTYTSPQPLNTVTLFVTALCAVFLLMMLSCAALIYTGMLGELYTPLHRVICW